LVEETIVEGGVIMTFLVPSVAVMVTWLLAFGAEAEIIHPPQLKQILWEQAEKLVAHYKSLCSQTLTPVHLPSP
jgi:predicted DNA-binding transcriptional regulator YafY